MDTNKTATREILERPFDQTLIKTRLTSFGSLKYVEGHEYIKRLNEAFSGKWSFEIVSHQITESEVIVVGKLVADGVAKVAFGGSNIKRRKESGEIICLADDCKGASTDALKKASSLFGVGLHLYADDSKENSTSKNSGERNGTAKGSSDNQSDGRKNDHGEGNGNGIEKPRLTSKQLACILAIGHEKELSREILNFMTLERFKCDLDSISKQDASKFIEELKVAA